ncbi:hypothetical protein [Actinomycetospora flava]|uniref:Excreted virulence factor EspC (Type VII ESX diderm) n=1 Tax=Actinomycetospora flava TaxID=3129232 RepID=A0ABU8M502_9PSEU
MTDPVPGPRLQAELDALRRDVGTWHEASQSLAEPTAAFSYLGESAGLPAAYAEIQQRIPELLGQAQEAMGAMGDTLVSAADTYQREDGEAAARLDPQGRGGR